MFTIRIASAALLGLAIAAPASQSVHKRDKPVPRLSLHTVEGMVLTQFTAHYLHEGAPAGAKDDREFIKETQLTDGTYSLPPLTEATYKKDDPADPDVKESKGDRAWVRWTVYLPDNAGNLDVSDYACQ